jgi:hypothetical protein
VVEQYASLGNRVEITAPLQRALDALGSWLEEVRREKAGDGPELRFVLVRSPREAATCAREWGAQLEEEADASAATEAGDQRVTAAALWRGRDMWLPEEEREVSSPQSAVAALG